MGLFRALTLAFLLLSVSLAIASDREGYLQDQEQGWFWYRALPPPPAPRPLVPPIAPASPAATAPAPAPFGAQWIRENLDHYRDVALDNPTLTNVKVYMYLQRLAMDKAQAFSQATKLAVYNDAALNEGARSADNQFAKAAVGQAQQRASDDLLKRLATSAGIWFFYRSDCQYCKAQEPILAGLRNQYGFHVLPISLDGLPMPGGQFPDFVRDDGQSARLHVTATPTLFLVAPPDRVLQISEGVLAADQLVDRIFELGRQAGWVSDTEYASVHAESHDGFLQSGLGDATTDVVDDPERLLALLESASKSGGSTPISATPIQEGDTQ